MNSNPEISGSVRLAAVLAGATRVQRPTRASLRRVLLRAFANGIEFDEFLIDQPLLSEVKREFNPNMDRSTQINLLFAAVDSERLLSLLREHFHGLLPPDCEALLVEETSEPLADGSALLRLDPSEHLSLARLQDLPPSQLCPWAELPLRLPPAAAEQAGQRYLSEQLGSRRRSGLSGLHPVRVPVWELRCVAQAQYQATRQVERTRETLGGDAKVEISEETLSTSGEVSLDAPLLLPGNRQLSPDELRALGPWDLREATAPTESAAGPATTAAQQSVATEQEPRAATAQALPAQAAQPQPERPPLFDWSELREQAQQILEARLSELAADRAKTTAANIVLSRVELRWSEATLRLLWLPLWQGSYAVGAAQHRVLLHGQTGRGESTLPPVGLPRWLTWLALLFLLSLIAALVLSS